MLLLITNPTLHGYSITGMVYFQYLLMGGALKLYKAKYLQS